MRTQRRRLARAYADGAFTEHEYERRLAELDARIQSAACAELPTIADVAALRGTCLRCGARRRWTSAASWWGP